MPARNPSTRVLVGRFAAECRHHPDRDPIALRRDLAAARIEEFVRRTMIDGISLTTAQLERILALLAPTSGAIGRAGS